MAFSMLVTLVSLGSSNSYCLFMYPFGCSIFVRLRLSFSQFLYFFAVSSVTTKHWVMMRRITSFTMISVWLLVSFSSPSSLQEHGVAFFEVYDHLSFNTPLFFGLHFISHLSNVTLQLKFIADTTLFLWSLIIPYRNIMLLLILYELLDRIRLKPISS